MLLKQQRCNMDSIFLSKSALFNGCAADEITNMLGCLNAERRSFHRGSIIYQAGEVVGGANLGGSANIGGLANTTTIVWGRIAGQSAAAYAASVK